MDDEAHIRLVYAHSEGYGRYYDVHFLHQELVLVLGSCLRIKTGMVRQRLDAVDVQELGQFLDLLPAQTVDDA